MKKKRPIRHIDYQNGSMLSCILQSALPLLAAQILNLLYNIVDRIYIARIPSVGTTAIGAVGLCFPVIILVTAFTNMYGSGGSPLFAIACGEGNTARAGRLLNLSLRLEILTAIVLTVSGELFCTPLLRLFGASSVTLPYARSYLRIYLLGNLFSMIATGMNPFINAQGFPLVGMVTVTIGALCNILLDPLFIFGFGMGVQGAAIATVISQALSALFVIRFLTGRTTLLRITSMSWREFISSGREIRNIISLGLSSFVMQVTNSLVSIACNGALSQTGGDLYISIMAIISSIRQIMDTPIFAISDGTSPVVSYNYGARRPDRVKEGIRILTLLGFLYTIAAWIFIVTQPDHLQVSGQKAKGDLLLTATQGSDRDPAHLSSAVRIPHGQHGRIYGGTCLQCDRRTRLLHHHAGDNPAGAETDGDGCICLMQSVSFLSHIYSLESILCGSFVLLNHLLLNLQQTVS